MDFADLKNAVFFGIERDKVPDKCGNAFFFHPFSQFFGWASGRNAKVSVFSFAKTGRRCGLFLFFVLAKPKYRFGFFKDQFGVSGGKGREELDASRKCKSIFLQPKAENFSTAIETF